MLSLPRAWVQSLVWELRSHKPCSTAKKQKRKKPKHLRVQPVGLQMQELRVIDFWFPVGQGRWKIWKICRVLEAGSMIVTTQVL